MKLLFSSLRGGWGGAPRPHGNLRPAAVVGLPFLLLALPNMQLFKLVQWNLGVQRPLLQFCWTSKCSGKI